MPWEYLPGHCHLVGRVQMMITWTVFWALFAPVSQLWLLGLAPEIWLCLTRPTLFRLLQLISWAQPASLRPSAYWKKVLRHHNLCSHHLCTRSSGTNPCLSRATQSSRNAPLLNQLWNTHGERLLVLHCHKLYQVESKRHQDRNSFCRRTVSRQARPMCLQWRWVWEKT